MASKTQVLLVGCGGVGTMAAVNLESGNLAEVTCVLRSNYDVVRDKGLTIQSCEHGELRKWLPTKILRTIPDASKAANERFDYIVCCTKNIPDIDPTLVDIIAPAISVGHTVIVLIQNGLNIEKPIQARFPQNVVLSGVSRIDAHAVATGVIDHRKRDLLYIGAFDSPVHSPKTLEEAAQQFVHIYSAGGRTTCLYRPDVGYDRWAKLVYNASFNPVCAITGLNSGEIQTTESAVARLIVPAMREIVSVAHAAGHTLPDGILEETIRSNPVEEQITPSMQLDTQRGNFTEHENLLGEVVREGRRLAVDIPIVATLYELCSAMQWRAKKEKGLLKSAII